MDPRACLTLAAFPARAAFQTDSSLFCFITRRAGGRCLFERPVLSRRAHRLERDGRDFGRAGQRLAIIVMTVSTAR
jgi:hypothetical protein